MNIYLVFGKNKFWDKLLMGTVNALNFKDAYDKAIQLPKFVDFLDIVSIEECSENLHNPLTSNNIGVK